MAESVEKGRTVVEVEALLRNGREVFLTLVLPRDSQQELDGVLVYRIEQTPGVVEEHLLPRAELAYLHTRTLAPQADPSGIRTLGRAETVGSAV